MGQKVCRDTGIHITLAQMVYMRVASKLMPLILLLAHEVRGRCW